MTLASYNSRKHKCLPDAITVTIADSLMSIVGGIAVFSVLGFMAKQVNRPVTDVVDEG